MAIKYRTTEIGELTGTQTLELRDLVSQLWSGAVSDLQSVQFSRNPETGAVVYHLTGKVDAASCDALAPGEYTVEVL